ncbi:hypothetical protein BCR33DRAFT_699345 [Rhizoclosmatium globosum]|uniref:Chromo domain-containing protein n=1 Tax=Rhizoclosmatium globosum TaxID=329046 RepID=A0A1Y2C1D8_9FUNG|nr:hypothetical protein BCR33DRAFT_699345 [Rhizoclosmatium globosum]|eukprot:ORY40697.1 hypothetical protein BCR33DRAFT_699345 [Rhizoclosmatium globosum]
MFGRLLNNFTDYSFDQVNTLSLEELQDRADHLHSLIFPIVKENLDHYRRSMATSFSKRHKVGHDLFPIDSYVITVPDNRKNKAEARYEGPFRVVKRTTGGTYQLLDADGRLLGRNYAPQQLKLVSGNTSFLPTTEVEAILERRQLPNSAEAEYLVSWKGYPESHNEWIPFSSFHDVQIVKEFNDNANPNPAKRKARTAIATAKKQK